ncbi:MAG: hypothetical protein K0R17_4049 [Rariglobus sp.]|jgi:sialate O-acetylesterase|nr:hypothetical protein [Rariglobus sp.]
MRLPIFLALLLAPLISPAAPSVAPSRLFADHMVLQRDKPIPVYGTGPAGATVSVTFIDRTVSTTVGEDGRWLARLAPAPAGGPHTLVIKSDGTHRTYSDILVGEVWLCIGQSNMYWESNDSDVKSLAAQAADHPRIRLAACTNTFHPTLQPGVSLHPSWSVPDATLAGKFSAVGYGFARDLQAALNVPVGIVRMAAGGVPIGAFMGPLSRDYDADVTAEITASGHGSVLYNGQIAPAVPFAIRGILYYQGEANQNSSHVYKRSLAALIREWRTLWNEPALPVGVIQCAGFSGGNFHWIRDAQTTVAQVVPGVGDIVSFDNADKSGIHPVEKRRIARRAADWALADVYLKLDYEKNRTSHLRDFTLAGNAVTLEFTRTGGALTVASGTVAQAFKLAGDDGRYHSATTGSIVGDTIVVSSAAVLRPVSVRYAFASDAPANLYNAGGHPIGPFRTDDAPLYGTPAGSDLARPSRPGAPAIARNGASGTLAWPAATDNVGVVEYLVYRDDELVAVTPGHFLALSGLADGQVLYIRARDYAMNVSHKSPDLRVGAR